MRAALEQFWYGLNLREQRLLMAAGALLAVAVLYWGAVHPLLMKRAEAERQLQHAQAQWQAVAKALRQLPQQTGVEKVVEEPADWLRNTARGSGLTISITVQADGAYRVAFAQTDAGMLAGWLKQVHNAGFGLRSLSLRQKQGSLQGQVVLIWQ